MGGVGPTIWGLIKSPLVWEGALRCQEGPLTLTSQCPSTWGTLFIKVFPEVSMEPGKQ